MKKEILKQLKSDYEELEIKPSTNLWEQIENTLEISSETAQKPSVKWWRYAAVVTLLFSLGGIFYFNSYKTLKTKEIIAAKKPSENISNPVKNIEPTDNFTSNKKNDDSDAIFNPSEIKVKQTDELAQKQSDDLEKVSEIPNVIPKIPLEADPKSQAQVLRPRISEIQHLAHTERKSEDKKTKYITANDLIFQRKYSIEKKENTQENVKRLGIIKISRINISPEIITAFDSNSTDK